MHVVSSATVIAVEWTLLGVCFAFIAARLRLRLRLQHKRPILSDYFICFAWLSGVCEAAIDLELKRLGWLDASSTWVKFESSMQPSLTRTIVFGGWFPLLTTQYLNKAALLSFFFNVFPPALRTFRYHLWAITLYSGLSYIVSILLVFLICVPSEDKGFSFTFCSAHSQLILWTTTWALHFSSDIFIFILPLSILRTLRLGWKKKFGLYITFGFGVFSIGACLIRFLVVTTTYPEVPMTNIEIWCALDSYVGLLVACLPSLRPYLNLKQETRTQLPTNYDGCNWTVLDGPSLSNCSLTTPPEMYCGESISDDRSSQQLAAASHTCTTRGVRDLC